MSKNGIRLDPIGRACRLLLVTDIIADNRPEGFHHQPERFIPGFLRDAPDDGVIAGLIAFMEFLVGADEKVIAPDAADYPFARFVRIDECRFALDSLIKKGSFLK